MKKTICTVDPVAEQRIAKSQLPQTFKDTFQMLFDASVSTNSEDSKASMKWHEPTVDGEVYVPVLTMRMVKKRVLDAEQKRDDAKMKKNPKKHFTARLKTGVLKKLVKK